MVQELVQELQEPVFIPTFLKWAGGKRKLLDQIGQHFPEKIDTYVEPFLGGGAVLFFVLQTRRPKTVIVSDINQDLINVYEEVRDDPEGLIATLKKYSRSHNSSSDPSKYYYRMRDRYNSTQSRSERAALFIYLNKTCFNGLFRVNSNNRFNVPYGQRHKISLFNAETIRSASVLLKNVTFCRKSFHELDYPRNCFVYFDPPYWSEPQNNGFTSYTQNDFSAQDQEQLRDLFADLSLRGCTVALSNSRTKYIENLYAGFKQVPVEVTWVINCDGAKRKKIKELLVLSR